MNNQTYSSITIQGGYEPSEDDLRELYTFLGMSIRNDSTRTQVYGKGLYEYMYQCTDSTGRIDLDVEVFEIELEQGCLKEHTKKLSLKFPAIGFKCVSFVSEDIEELLYIGGKFTYILEEA